MSRQIIFYISLSYVISWSAYLIGELLWKYSRRGKYEYKVRYKLIREYLQSHHKGLWGLKSEMALPFLIPFYNVFYAGSYLHLFSSPIYLKDLSHATLQCLDFHLENNYSEYMSIANQKTEDVNAIRYYAIKMAMDEKRLIKEAKKKIK